MVPSTKSGSKNVSRPENTPGTTPVNRLFVYHIFGEPAELQEWLRDPGTYSLRVGGLAARELSLTLEELQSDFPAVEREVILQCMTNGHWGRVRVRGARLGDIIQKANPHSGARKVLITGGDGFTSDLWLREIEESPDNFLLAWEINGDPLDQDHGYPLRVVSETRYGYKWCKWAVSIEITDQDVKGHYEGRRGWSDEGLRGQPVT